MNNSPEPAVDRPAILVVEDHTLEQRLLLQLAKKCGFDVEIASNTEEALKAFESGRTFALILMDWKLPGMDGLECTRQIRDLEKDRGYHTPVIAITGRALEGDRKKCLTAGMDDYMSKPFSMEEFRQMLARWAPQPAHKRTFH